MIYFIENYVVLKYCAEYGMENIKLKVEKNILLLEEIVAPVSPYHTIPTRFVEESLIAGEAGIIIPASHEKSIPRGFQLSATYKFHSLLKAL